MALVARVPELRGHLLVPNLTPQVLMLSVQGLASRQRCCSSLSCDSNLHSLGRRARSVIPVTSCVTSVTLRSFSKPLCHRDFSVAFVLVFSLSLLGIVAAMVITVKGRIGLFA